MSPCRRKPPGFTLLEVLIALAIVAMSVGALLGTVSSSASNVIYLKDKTMAEWVALNRLTEIRIAREMPAEGKRTGETVMGGMRWQWEEEVTELPVKGMFRIDVRSRPTGEAVDDTRQQPEADKAQETVDADTKASGEDLEEVAWTTVVTGVTGSARSPRQDAIAIPYAAISQGDPNNPGEGGQEGAPPDPNNPNPNPGPGPKPSPGTQDR